MISGWLLVKSTYENMKHANTYPYGVVSSFEIVRVSAGVHSRTKSEDWIFTNKWLS
jgi:hypothetical protein